MRKLAHKFLTWSPPALAGSVLAAAAIWTEVRDWIAKMAVEGWAARSDPAIVLVVIILVAAYVWATVFTGREHTSKSKAKPFAQMANSDLRSVATDRAAKIRIFARDADLALRSQESQSSWLARQEAFGNAYRTEHWPEARLVVIEMRKRLGLPSPDFGDVAIDRGILAGPHPLLDAANLLDQLANQLQD